VGRDKKIPVSERRYFYNKHIAKVRKRRVKYLIRSKRSSGDNI